MLTLCHNFFRVYPGNRNGKDGNQHISKRKFAFGVVILLLVVILWVASSELTKYIYVEKKLDRPFLVTYVRSSLLFIYLLVLCFSPPTRDPCRPTDYTQLLDQSAETDDENNFFSESTNSLGDSTFVPVRAGETTDSDDAAPRAVRFNKVAEVRVMSAAMAGEALLARLSWAASVRATEYAQRRAAAQATRRHLKLALMFCVPWFVSNYLYRMSLLYGSTSSSSTFVSMTAAMALSVGAFGQPPGDTRAGLTTSKTISILLITMGMVVLAVTETNDWRAVAAALGSAVCYTSHLLMFRQEMRGGDGINSPLLVGLVGCACACLVWVMGVVLGVVGVERAELPPARMWSWLLLDAALGPLLMESLWLLGRSLTSSRLATGMLGLCLPLAASVESYLGRGGAWGHCAGALAGAGWAFAAIDAPRARLPLRWLRARLRPPDSLESIRNITDLDEQSEALMSADEPT